MNRCMVHLCLIVGSVAASAQGTLLVNGSLEDPVHSDLTINDGGTLYWYRRLTSQPFVGWTTDLPMAVFRTRPGAWEAQDGNQYIELESGFGHWIEQTLPTVPGQMYTLGFWYAANPGVAVGSADDSIRVFWGGVEVDLVDGSDSGIADLNWSYHQYTLTATSSATVLRFEDGFAGLAFAGGFLDNISVVPGSGSLLGLVPGVMMLWRRRR